MKSIRYIFRTTCASFLPCLIISGSGLGWDMCFDIILSVVMVIGIPIGYPLGYSINMLLGLELDNYFGTWEISLVVVSLGTLYGLIIDTV